jgi:hypothetical protein
VATSAALLSLTTAGTLAFETVGAQIASASVPCSTLELPVKIAPGVFNAPIGATLHFVVSSTLVATDCPISAATVTFTDPHGTTTTLTTTGAIGPGESVTWGTVDYTIAAIDIGTHGAPPNFVLGHATADGTATEPSNATVPQGSVDNADVFVNQPSTSLTESASPSAGRIPLPVTFTYHETNTGTDAITDVAVSGSVCGSATYQSGDANSNGVLDPGETWIYTCQHTFTTVGSFTDNGLATGSDVPLDEAAPDEHASATVQTHDVSTSLTESASPTTGRVPLPVTFTYHESNTSADPITDVSVSGSICGTATYLSGDANTNGVLDPGETWVYTCQHTFNVAGNFTDNATATGTDTVDDLAAPVELASASVATHAPHTTLTESASPASGRAPLPVTFTYDETNDGSDSISNVSVSGSICGTATYQSGDVNTNGVLDPGETWVYTCQHTFATVGSYTDMATADGMDVADGFAAPEESASASVTVAHPATDLAESASPSTGTGPLPVTFTYDETNSGDDPISDVTVSGSICGTATYQSGDTNTNGVLDPGETWVYTCQHTFNTVGSYTDVATANGTDTVDGLAAPVERASASVTVTSLFTSNYTPGFWKNHASATTKLLPQYLGGYEVSTFAQAQSILSGMGCGHYGSLNCMAGMLLAAQLNLQQGGNTCITPVTNAANALLAKYSYSGLKSYSIAPADSVVALLLHDELSAYNIDGVPSC